MSYINKLDNYELVYLFKNRIKDYMPFTRKKIKNELKSRNLTVTDFDSLSKSRQAYVQSKKSEQAFCPNCLSSKFFREEIPKIQLELNAMNESEWNQAKASEGLQIIRCSLCLIKLEFNIIKSPSILERLQGEHQPYLYTVSKLE